MKSAFKFAALLAFLTAAVAPAHAGENRDLLESRMKTALNEMVQEVRAAETPEAKRETLEGFIGKVERRAGWLESMPFMDAEHRAALSLMKDKFAGYHAELQGLEGKTRVADGELDAFAGFVQHDLEQADAVAWDGGGIYLSVGAIIIILIILVLVT